MTYKGIEIGYKASLCQIEEYIADKGLIIDAVEAHDYWTKKEWLTNKGVPVKTLEGALDALNSIEVHRERLRAKREKKKQLMASPKMKAEKIIKRQAKKKKFILYEDQLKDKRWEAFRTFIFAVKGRRCEICQSKERLQVHHMKYRNALAWEYTCKEVLVVCRNCHLNIHGIKEVKKRKYK